MKANTIKQRMIRLAGVAALTIGLALSTGVVAAMPSQVGLTECDHAGCEIATVRPSVKRGPADVTMTEWHRISFSGGPLGPHLIP